jgi:hypothetical protein
MEEAKIAIVTWLTRSMLLTHFRYPTRFTEPLIPRPQLHTIQWTIITNLNKCSSSSST